MTNFALEPIYGSTLLALALAGALVALMIWITPPTSDPDQRRWLIGLRCVAGLALLLAVFRPALLRTDNRPADATIVIAADVSRSMTLPDGDGDGDDRWSSQLRAWRTLAAGLQQLDDSLAVRLLIYDQTARSVADVAPDALDAQQPSGELTDLAAAALAAIGAADGQPIAGVVLMGDGTQTAPIEGTGAQRVVETLNSLGVPLWCVPIGPAGGETASRDVAVDALPESYQLFAGNEVNIDFQVQTRGLSGVDVPVRLVWIDEQGNMEEVATRSVISGKSVDVASLSVPVIVPPPGTYRLRVEATSQAGELVTVNNSQIAFADVREGGGRILYLEGTLREEQLRLRMALRRFPDLDMTYQWIPADTVSAWPVDLEHWIRPGRFDVFMIGDLDAAAIGTEQLQQLADAVSAGAGLLMLGGYQTYGRGGYADSPLADVLPVEMDAALRRRVGGPPDDQTGQLAGPLSIQLTRRDGITDLGGDDPGLIWQQLPPLQGANDLGEPKVLPGVRVLLESSQQDPLLVVGQYGRGRTAALAMDSTWRWWRAGKTEVHKRFWRQLMLWMLARENVSGDKINIDLDSRRFDVADPPRFRASIESVAADSPPIPLTAEIVGPDDQTTPLATSTEGSPDNQSAIVGTLPKLAPGFYRLRVQPTDSQSTIEPEEQAFQVIDQSRELARPMADPVYLRQLAELTAGHGGAAFAPDEMDALVETIAQRRQQAETPIVEKMRVGDGPFSGWIVFAVFATALCGEWLLRRRWGIA
ncbi:MAG: glutamine amidotransferase [Pirellulales bacterium]|nr:glutamine amidotransferase [Pirellulales bacterium]